MRKLFSFRSSGSSSGNSSHDPSATSSDKLPLDKHIQNNMKKQVHSKSSSPKDSSSRPGEHQGSVGAALRRSFSFSSSNICYDLAEQSHCRSPSMSRNFLLQGPEYNNQTQSLTPDRLPKSKRGDKVAVLKRVDRLDSPTLSNGCADSSGNSPCSSPVPLQCRAPCLIPVSNNVLDLYIDGEQQEEDRRLESVSQRCSPTSKLDNCLLKSRTFESSNRPPRVQSRGPTSPTNSKEHLRSHSFREVRDKHVRNSREWARGSSRPSSPQRFGRCVVEKLAEAYPDGPKLRSSDFDSETSTSVEDIFVDYSDDNLILNSNNFSGKSFKPDVSYEAVTRQCLKEIKGFQRRKFHTADELTSMKNERLHLKKDEEVDAQLRMKIKETEERVMLLSEEYEDGHMTTRNIMNEVQILALELSSQLKSRITERASAREAIRLLQIELDSRTRRLEKENKELQSSLEKELDRRSSDWSLKLEKYQSEEQRLRERVRELAEQNVSLQREVSMYNSRDVEGRSKLVELETQLNDLSCRMEEVESEKCKLQTAVVELGGRASCAESDRDCIKRSHREKDQEVKDLQKALSRLQRECHEQGKTISGLRQDLHDGITSQSSDSCNGLRRLQMEQVRLSGIEQKLRRETESYRCEVDSLRNENISLLNRLNGGKNSSFRLEQELQSQVDFFRNQSLSLHDTSSELCGHLLEYVKACQLHEGVEQSPELKCRFDGYSVIEYDMKLQNLRRGIVNIRRGWETVSAILEEKDDPDTANCQSGNNECCSFKEVDLERELKAEILLSRALREKLCSQDVELNQLQADLAASIRGNEILRCEIQVTKDAVSCLTHKLKDAELQMRKKNEAVNQLQDELHDRLKELSVAQGILTKVSEERNAMWEELKQSSEKNMQLNYEVNSLKKKVETLEEDILVKEGQMSILRDNIKRKPFDILYDSNSTEEFILQ